MHAERHDISTNEGLDTLGAYLAYLRGENDAALSRLEGKADPESLRRRLEILLELKRYPEAASIVREHKPHAVWSERGVAALAWNDDLREARALIAWAKAGADRATWRRCLLRYADARYQKVLECAGHGAPLLPGDLRPEQTDMLRDALDVLEPNLLSVGGKEGVENELESLSIQIALHACSLLGEHRRAAAFGKLLNTRTPVPLALPQFVLERVITTPPDLAERLRLGHPDSFAARVMALRLDAEQQQPPLSAFEEAKSLVATASTTEDREFLCNVLNEIGQQVSADALCEVDVIVSSLLPLNHGLRQLFAADRLVRWGPTEEARGALEAIRDEHDPYWLQLYGNYLLRIGDGRSAVDYFARASERYAHPHLLRTAAQVALDFGRLTIAQGTLERLLSREPEAIPERRRLAIVYARQSLFGKAAEQFRLLRDLEPNDVTHAFNEALSLRDAGLLSESLQVFDGICAAPDPPLRALLARVDVLKTMGRAPQALESLLRHKGQFWDDYHYVGTLLLLAHAAGRDELGAEALSQLTRLQRDGKAPADILLQKSIEDLKQELAKGRERADLAYRLVLQGRSPWLFADSVGRQPAYWAWSVRTQPLNWLADDPIQRAQFEIYATNGFVVRRGNEPSGRVEPVKAPGRGTLVSADLTALITLHRLDLIEPALEYLGQILIPADYITHAVAELEQLRDHQPSQRYALEAVKTAFDVGTLKVALDAGRPGDRPYAYVSEHTLDEEDAAEHHYRLTDLIAPIFSSGHASDPERKKLQALSRKPTGVDSSHPALALGQSVLVELSTLKTLAQYHALPALLETFDVYLSGPEREEVVRELNAYLQRDRIRSLHEDLFERIRNDIRIVKAPVEVPPGWDSERVETPFAAALLADSKSVPILADDRVIQVIVANAHSLDDAPAFGTDALLAGMHAGGILTPDEFYRKLLQLMDWRYRFIIPPPEMLAYFAAEYAGNPPGDVLIRVARYFHDCTLDPGLFAGLEPTAPPVSMAGSLYLAIVGTIAEFLTDVWKDEAVDEDAAKTITEWAIREMLPPPPKSMGAHGELLSSARNSIMLGRGLLRGCTGKDVWRAHRGLKALATALNMNDEEYWSTVTRVINAA